MEDLQDKIIELMDLFDDEEVTTADKIDRPQRALDREAIDDFMKRNPMAGGGMLVQPSAYGSRPGYAKDDVKKQKVGKYTVERKGPAGLLQPRDMVAEPLTSYEKIKLKKKFPNIKFNFKEYPNFGIGSYDKKLKRKVNTKEYDAVRRFIFRGFVDTTKFKILPVSVQNEIKGQFPEVKNWDFKKYAYGVSPGRIGERERQLKGLPPKDNRALIRKIARFVDEPEEFRYKFRVGNADGFMLYSMDRAFLQGNENYKPIKQGGKVVGFIDYTKDGGGKKYYYNGYIVNNKLKPGEKIIKDHPDFKKVKKFHEVSLRSKLSLDDTSDVFKQLFPKGFDTSKIKFNDLIQFVSNKASKRNIYNAIVKHHTTGVGTNPTKDLQILTSVFNKQADDIGALIKKGDFSRVQELKDKGIRIVVDGKAYGAPKETAETGYQRILSNVIEDVKTYKSKDFKKLKKFLATLGGGKCKTKGFLNQGGRVGLQDGTPSVDVCFTNALERIRKGGVDFTKAEAMNFDKLTKGLRAIGASNIMKFGVIPEALFEGALIANKMVSEGDSAMQGVRNSYLAIPFQKLGLMQTYDEGRREEILNPEKIREDASPLGEIQKKRVKDVMSLQNTLNEKNQLLRRIQGLQGQAEDIDAISEGSDFGYVGDSQAERKKITELRADLQDMYRGDAKGNIRRAERLLTTKPIDLNINDQLIMDAYNQAVEKANALRASKIKVAPGTGFAVDRQIKKRMDQLPITSATAEQDLKATGDFFGTGYTPLSLNKLYTLMGRQDPKFGIDEETGKYNQEQGIEDYKNYLRTLRFADNFREEKAGGGIAKEAGDPSGAMLQSMNPDSQGLRGLLKRGKKI